MSVSNRDAALSGLARAVESPERLPPRVRAALQRMLEAEARQLLAEQMDADAAPSNLARLRHLPRKSSIDLAGVAPRRGALAEYKRALRRDPCAYCGAPAGGYREIDHITPRSKGGPNHWSNYTAACEYCNRLKYDDPGPLEYLLSLGKVRDLIAREARRAGLPAPRIWELNL